MATYTAITDAEIDQDSPITQTLMTKYRDNLIATTEGATGAPRVEALARSFEFLTLQSATGTTAIGWTSLETNWLIQLFLSFNIGDAGVVNFQIRATANNGSTWSSYVNVTGVSLVSVPATFNTKTGIFTWTGGTVNTTVTNANGVQFRWSGTGFPTAPSLSGFGYAVSRGEV